MDFSFLTRKGRRAKLIKNIIADVARTGIGPPPEFFTSSELKELQTAVERADEYDSLFTTIEYPEILQEGREIVYERSDDIYEELE